MLRDHGRHPQVGNESQHNLENILRGLGIELRGRLIKDQGCRMCGEGGGDGHALPLAAR